MNDDRQVPAGPEHVLPHVAGLARLLERGDDDLVLRQVFAADVDEGEVGADRVCGDDDALDEEMRDAHHDLAVLERPGLGFVRVDDEVDRLGRVLGLWQEARLATHGEARPAAPADVGGEQLVEDRLSLHPEGLAQRFVAADGLVLRELGEVAGGLRARGGALYGPSRSSLTIAGTSTGCTGSW